MVTDKNMLRFVGPNRFSKSASASDLLCTLSAEAIDKKKGLQVKAMIDKLHNHVCGHATFTILNFYRKGINFGIP